MATLEAGVEIAPGLRFGLEQAFFFGKGSTQNGTFLQVGFQLPLGRDSGAKAGAVDAATADDDADGVANASDDCAGTVAGTRVDARGCPADADRDGVADAGDLCAATPAGARVDARGCPTDADADGVLDGLDRCPASPAGTRVDARGCARSPLADALAGGRAVLASLRFRAGTAELMAGGESTLAEIAALLLGSPQLQAEIAVFTDTRGDAGRNRALAQQRAERIVALVRERAPGLAADRLVARGYGEDAPLLGEDTAPSARRGDRVEARIRAVAATH
jgi:OOP family OmpA-OmpF porin